MPWVVAGFLRQRLPTRLHPRGCHEVVMRLSWASHERVMWLLVPCPLLKTNPWPHSLQTEVFCNNKRGGVEEKDKETVQHAIMLTSVREQIRLFTLSFFLSKHTHTAKICGSKDKREFFTQMLPSEFSSIKNTK